MAMNTSPRELTVLSTVEFKKRIDALERALIAKDCYGGIRSYIKQGGRSELCNNMYTVLLHELLNPNQPKNVLTKNIIQLYQDTGLIDLIRNDDVAHTSLYDAYLRDFDQLEESGLFKLIAVGFYCETVEVDDFTRSLGDFISLGYLINLVGRVFPEFSAQMDILYPKVNRLDMMVAEFQVPV